jgi:hypothetical protein
MTFTVGLPNALMDGTPVPSFWIRSIYLYGVENKIFKGINR